MNQVDGLPKNCRGSGTTSKTLGRSRATEPYLGPVGSAPSRHIEGVAAGDDDGYPHTRGCPDRVDVLELSPLDDYTASDPAISALKVADARPWPR